MGYLDRFKTQTPVKAAGPIKAHGLLPIQKKGKDSKKPSMRPIRIPLEPAKTISASLEGSGPTLERVTHFPPRSRAPLVALERVTHLRLARGHLSA